ncbi:hypothetical protein ERJ75_001761500 [Trypanosoma vivax]|nr:hypothetical protein ERJ75_001761100 [Trypanosoma vivax]KAH8604006.1 hypothetical protein ERJ75_001761500 [Trypanosoma vivax]
MRSRNSVHFSALGTCHRSFALWQFFLPWTGASVLGVPDYKPRQRARNYVLFVDPVPIRPAGFRSVQLWRVRVTRPCVTAFVEHGPLGIGHVLVQWRGGRAQTLQAEQAFSSRIYLLDCAFEAATRLRTHLMFVSQRSCSRPSHGA